MGLNEPWEWNQPKKTRACNYDGDIDGAWWFQRCFMLQIRMLLSTPKLAKNLQPKIGFIKIHIGVLSTTTTSTTTASILKEWSLKIHMVHSHLPVFRVKSLSFPRHVCPMSNRVQGEATGWSPRKSMVSTMWRVPAWPDVPSLACGSVVDLGRCRLPSYGCHVWLVERC